MIEVKVFMIGDHRILKQRIFFIHLVFVFVVGW